jgi:hypothetical protein
MTCEHYFLNVDCRTLDARALGVTAQLTDPPYDPHVHASMTSCAQVGDVKGVRHRDAGFAALDASLFAYVVDVAKVVPGWSAIYCDLESVGTYAEALGRRTKGGVGYVRGVVVSDADMRDGDFALAGYGGVLPWIRWSSPQQSDDRPSQGAEALVLAHGPGKMHWRGPRNLTELRHKCERGTEKHATAKPLDQELDLVAWFTDPGDLVYDPTGGRGTLGVACVLLGRSYVGCNWGDGPDAALAAEEHRKGLERINEAKAGRFSPRDTERAQRWLNSVTDNAPKFVGSMPEEFWRLVKGRVQ